MNRSWYFPRGKRVLDLAVALLGLTVSSPVTGAVMLAIRLETPGPALYRQTRIGQDGRAFDILKFRTMIPVEHSYDSEGRALENYERVTRVGRLLRRTSLDEVPQLFNVLRGEMSIVGPRPTLEYQVRRYNPEQRRRLDVRPGLTGLAQVRGRNSLSWDEKIRFDLEYVDRCSLLLDLKILASTVRVVLRQEGVAFSAHDSLSTHDGDYRDNIGTG